MSWASCNKRGHWRVALALLALSGCVSAPVQQDTTAASAPPQPAPAPVTPAPTAPPAVASAETQAAFADAVRELDSGDPAKAEAMFSALLGTHPQFATVHANLALAQKKQGKLAEAEAFFKQALALNKDLGEIYNQLALLYRESGRFDLARQTYEAGIAAAPDHANLYLNLAILHDLYLGQPEKAIPQYQHYVKRVPDDKQAEQWLIELQRRLAVAK